MQCVNIITKIEKFILMNCIIIIFLLKKKRSGLASVKMEVESSEDEEDVDNPEDKDARYPVLLARQNCTFGQISRPIGQRIRPIDKANGPFGQLFSPFGELFRPLGQVFCPFSQVFCPFSYVFRPLGQLFLSFGIPVFGLLQYSYIGMIGLSWRKHH